MIHKLKSDGVNLWFLLQAFPCTIIPKSKWPRRRTITTMNRRNSSGALLVQHTHQSSRTKPNAANEIERAAMLCSQGGGKYIHRKHTDQADWCFFSVYASSLYWLYLHTNTRVSQVYQRRNQNVLSNLLLVYMMISMSISSFFWMCVYKCRPDRMNPLCIGIWLCAQSPVAFFFNLLCLFDYISTDAYGSLQRTMKEQAKVVTCSHHGVGVRRGCACPSTPDKRETGEE